jgi:hypothetical protein
MTNAEIERKFEFKVKQERKLTRELIELIALVDKRKIYALRGYSSLYDFLTKKYGYSEGAANRRISAARLLRSVPEAKGKIESGELNLTTMAKAQNIMRAQEKVLKKSLSTEAKIQALAEIKNKSTVQAEQTLLALFPEAASTIKKDRVMAIDECTLRLSANIPSEVMERFEQVKNLLSNTLPNATFIEVADYLFKKLLKDEATATTAKQCAKNDNKTVTPKTRRIVLKGGVCTYQDPITRKICGSRHQLQVDHRHPKALGGDNSFENLRPLCATHNRLMAEQTLGKAWANKWRERRP